MKSAEAATNNNGQVDTAESGVRVLLLDTPENEGIDFLQSLKQQGMKFVSERVGGKDELFKALQAGTWDILLVNDRVREPESGEILEHLARIKSETGYVLLSSSEITIDSLTDAYSSGISDVVSDHHRDYSCEVFSRAAERSRRNLQLSQLNQEKFELTRHRDQLMSGTEEALAYLQDGIHLFANDAYLKMLGYKDMEDLAVMPFIDVVSNESRDKVKQQLLDYQHKVRMKPDSEAMALEELFVTGVSEKEGVLQVHATFKAVVYDGQDCIQVVLRDKAALEGQESAGAVEGLGYPLFVSHLDNFIADARSSSALAGQVVHIAVRGCEHYIARKGYGSLNGKMKALSSVLKTGLKKDDFMIRFTENSFLILLKGDESRNVEMISRQSAILEKFTAALNSEIPSKEEVSPVIFSQDIIPVDSGSESAEQLIRSFLLGGAGSAPVEERKERKDSTEATDTDTPTEKTAATQDGNVVPFNKTTAQPAPSKTGQQEQEQEQKKEVQGDKSASGGNEESVKSREKAAVPESQPGTGDADTGESINQDELNAALKGNRLALYYEPVISVSDIETEFYDLAVYRNDGQDCIDRKQLGDSLARTPLAGKLDMWALEHAVNVIAELYNQGQEYRIRLPLTASSLEDRQLPEVLKKMLNDTVLPYGMVILDVAIGDLQQNAEQAREQLELLKNAGAHVCISGVKELQPLQPFVQKGLMSLVTLDHSLVERAASDEAALARLNKVNKALHSAKIKVCAEEINNSELLSTCCKARLDLVQGAYIQKSPTPLSAESLSVSIAI